MSTKKNWIAFLQLLLIVPVPLVIYLAVAADAQDETWTLSASSILWTVGITLIIAALLLPRWLQRRSDMLRQLRLEREAAHIKELLGHGKVFYLVYLFDTGARDDHQNLIVAYHEWLKSYVSFVETTSGLSAWRDHLSHGQGTMPLPGLTPFGDEQIRLLQAAIHESQPWSVWHH